MKIYIDTEEEKQRLLEESEYIHYWGEYVKYRTKKGKKKVKFISPDEGRCMELMHIYIAPENIIVGDDPKAKWEAWVKGANKVCMEYDPENEKKCVKEDECIQLPQTWIEQEKKYSFNMKFIEIGGSKQLICIDIVAGDGRKYYALSSEYNYLEADEQTRKNVIAPIFNSIGNKEKIGERCIFPGKNPFVRDNMFNYGIEWFHVVEGKPMSQIKQEILDFVGLDVYTVVQPML